MTSTLKVPFSVYVCKSAEGGQDESNISSFRFERREVPSWADMKAMIKAQYDIKSKVLLKHIDSDHEEITIGSQEEWKLAVKAAEKESNQLFLKVFVLPEEDRDELPRPAHRGARCKKEVLRSHLLNINSKVDHLTKELSSVKLTQQQQEEILRQQAVVAQRSVDADKPVVHDDVLCSLCRQLVIGIRYKCVNCSQYNLCEQCEKSSDRAHPDTHVFLKIQIPLDRKIDTWISKFPLLGCNLYESSSVERFLRKLYHIRPHRRHRSSSSSSGSSTSSGSTSTSSEDSELERRRNRRRKHGRTSSNSTSAHGDRRRRKYRRRRSRSSSTSSSSSGSTRTSSLTGSSHSASIITLDSSSKRRRDAELCRYGHHHKGRPCRRHLRWHRRHEHRDKESNASSHKHGGSRRGHRQRRHHRHHRRFSEERPLLSEEPPANVVNMEDSERLLADWADAQKVRCVREMVDLDAGNLDMGSSIVSKDGLQDVMMTEQEMQKFRARLNRLVDAPQTSRMETEEATAGQEYFVQTGCGLGDWVPVTDQPSVSAVPTEGGDSISDFTLVDSVASVQQQQELEEEEAATQEEQEEPQASATMEEEPQPKAALEEPKEPEEPEEPQKEPEETQKEAEPTQEEPQQPKQLEEEEEDRLPETAPVLQGTEPQLAADSAPLEGAEGAASSPIAYPQVPPAAPAQEQRQPPTYPQYPPQPNYAPPYVPSQQPYPVSGQPLYPYPGAYPAVDGNAAANLWSATTNMLRSMQSGWQGFVGGHPSEPRPAPDVRPYDYQTNKEMQQLVEMGFCNRELNKQLLDKHDQNVDRVVLELINETNDSWYSSRH